jgi:hypothetical protein
VCASTTLFKGMVLVILKIKIKELDISKEFLWYSFAITKK